MLAVGEHALGDLDDRTRKMATGFSGGIGITYRDLCGALTAGVMLIGAIHGRSHLDESDAHCQKLVTNYRDRFMQEFDFVHCHELRAEKYGSSGNEPCWVLVERAAFILLSILEK
ncbi:MAG: C-GCAxxG-C-C family protein [Chloroflexota bacterium]|nr:C-GCAxxG-C-C family protein [Chloroflexota bacterium]